MYYTTHQGTKIHQSYEAAAAVSSHVMAMSETTDRGVLVTSAVSEEEHSRLFEAAVMA
jgi:hypothetical protein